MYLARGLLLEKRKSRLKWNDEWMLSEETGYWNRHLENSFEMLILKNKAKIRVVYRDRDSDVPFIMNLFLVIWCSKFCKPLRYLSCRLFFFWILPLMSNLISTEEKNYLLRFLCQSGHSLMSPVVHDFN